MYRKYVEPAFKPRRNEFIALIQERIVPLQRKELVPPLQSDGRVCAKDIFARNTLPNHPVSIFDGIGVRFDAFQKGIPDTSGWRCGEEYVFCNTGIAMPEGFDTVIIIEEVEIENGVLTIHKAPETRSAYVGEVGANMREGELLISEGTVITPAQVGLLAAGAIAEVSVLARPRVAIIPTGNELVPPTADVPIGKNVESNSYMIASYLSRWGALPTISPIIQDDPAKLAKAFKTAIIDFDMVVVIAGSSRGSEDYTIDVLRELGEVVVPELAHGPGRKSSLTMVGDKPILGVAGPPLGAQITCDLYMHPIVQRLLGQPISPMPTLKVISDDEFIAHEVDFCERVHIYCGADGYHIRSAFQPKTTRAQMEAIANGNFYRVAGSSCKAGEIAEVELLRPIESIPQEDQIKKILN